MQVGDMKNSYKKGSNYEKSEAKELGKVQPGSGNRWMSKQDIVGEGPYKDFLFQLKNVSGQKSHSLNRLDLKELVKDASRMGRTGIYLINFGEDEEFVVMRKSDWQFLLKEEDEI